MVPLGQELRGHFHSLLDAVGAVYAVNPDYADEGEPWGMAHVTCELGVDIAVVMLSHDPGASIDAYLLALHELGHLYLLRDGDAWDPGAQDNATGPDVEARAWQWALDRTIITPTRDDYRRILDRLMTYRSSQWEELVTRLRALTVNDGSATRGRARI